MTMLYRKLMNKLFGWEYYVYQFGHSEYIGRAHYANNNRPYCLQYGTLVWLDEPRYHYYGRTPIRII